MRIHGFPPVQHRYTQHRLFLHPTPSSCMRMQQGHLGLWYCCQNKVETSFVGLDTTFHRGAVHHCEYEQGSCWTSVGNMNVVQAQVLVLERHIVSSHSCCCSCCGESHMPPLSTQLSLLLSQWVFWTTKVCKHRLCIYHFKPEETQTPLQSARGHDGCF